MKLVRRLAAAAAIALSPMLSHAGLVTYDFTVTATNGPLKGQSSTGYFSFNTPTATMSLDKFTDLHFTWDGVTYDETMANTGILNATADGALTWLVFGGGCGEGYCYNLPSSHWIIMDGWFGYADGRSMRDGTVVYSLRTEHVPEPGSIALSSLALGLMGVTVVRRQRKSQRNTPPSGVTAGA